LAAVAGTREQVGGIFLLAIYGDERALLGDAQGRVDVPADTGLDAHGRWQCCLLRDKAPGEEERQSECKDLFHVRIHLAVNVPPMYPAECGFASENAHNGSPRAVTANGSSTLARRTGSFFFGAGSE